MDIRKLSIFLSSFALVFLRDQVPTYLFFSCLICLSLYFVKIQESKLKTFLKILILTVNIFLLWKRYHSFLNTECAISLVTLLCFLKTLELNTLDDLFHMFLILVLTEACIIITNPTPLIFILSFVKIAFYFYFLLKMQNYELGAIKLRRILILLLPALFFSLILYFTFPRFTQGFLAFSPNDQLFSSSNDLDIKALGEVNLSDKKVFTVFNFPQNIISPTNLYWKTNILWDIKKEQWRSANSSLRSSIETISNQNYKFNYQIKTENIFLDFIPHTDHFSNVSISDRAIKYYKDNSFKLSPVSRGTFTINVGTNLEPLKKESAIETEKGLKLPIKESSDDQIEKLIFKGTSAIHVGFDKRKELVQSFFMSKNYQYTKNPPAYRSIQDFILNGKLGYCSHFAAAYAYLLRLANIPSRVVIGYQGAEINPFDNSLIIRERDSHAWIEYLNQDNSWHRIDPTEFVAPARIRLGSQSFFDQLDPYLENNYFRIPKIFSPFRLINHFENLTSSIDNFLSNYLFNLDYSEQKRILNNKMGWYFVATLIIFLIFFYFLVKKSSHLFLNKAEKKYKNFISNYSKKGYPKREGETASEYKNRLLNIFPEKQKEITNETETYIRHFYQQ